MRDEPCLVLLIAHKKESAIQVRTALDADPSQAYSLDSVASLPEAADRLAQHRYDVLLLNLSLPEVEDLQALQQLREQSPGVPIAVITDSHEEAIVLRAVKAGADDVILMGTETEETVAQAIINAVNRARDQQRQQIIEKRLLLLANQLPCVFWTTDSHLRITSFDGGGTSALGLQPSSVIGEDVGSLMPAKKTSAPLREAHRQALQGSPASLDIELQGRLYCIQIEPFRERDGRLVGTLGLAVDVTDQRLQDLELQLTRQIQEGLLPSSAPQVPGFDIDGASVSVAEAGGDYFDYFPVGDQTLGIAVCDVGGHGLGPAMMMSHVRAYLRALALTHSDPGQILTQVNAFLCEDLDEERLVTLFFAKLDAASRTMTYCSAGHQGYRMSADGRAERFEPNALPLNVLAEATAETAPPVELAPGDLVIIYTDGIVENPTVGGEQFGTENMLGLLRDMCEQPAAHIVAALLQAVREQSPQQRIYDDMTVVVIKAE